MNQDQYSRISQQGSLSSKTEFGHDEIHTDRPDQPTEAYADRSGVDNRTDPGDRSDQGQTPGGGPRPGSRPILVPSGQGPSNVPTQPKQEHIPPIQRGSSDGPQNFNELSPPSSSAPLQSHAASTGLAGPTSHKSYATYPTAAGVYPGSSVFLRRSQTLPTRSQRNVGAGSPQGYPLESYAQASGEHEDSGGAGAGANSSGERVGPSYPDPPSSHRTQSYQHERTASSTSATMGETQASPHHTPRETLQQGPYIDDTQWASGDYSGQLAPMQYHVTPHFQAQSQHPVYRRPGPGLALLPDQGAFPTATAPYGHPKKPAVEYGDPYGFWGGGSGGGPHMWEGADGPPPPSQSQPGALPAQPPQPGPSSSSSVLPLGRTSSSRGLQPPSGGYGPPPESSEYPSPWVYGQRAARYRGPQPSLSGTEMSPYGPLSGGPDSGGPALVRTSALSQAASSWGYGPMGGLKAGLGAMGGMGGIGAGLSSGTRQASLTIEGDLDEVVRDWDYREIMARRRLVQFDRYQEGTQVRVTFRHIKQEDYDSRTTVISCIYWKEFEQYYVTSVDCILLLELIINQKFSVEEKNRIRRNLEVCKPLTVSKNRQDSSSFFRLIMKFEAPRPRNIEKDVKVFPWIMLGDALKKIVGKYSVNYLSPE